MIQLQQLVEIVESGLNALLEESPLIVSDTDKYLFHIFPDTGEYKKAERIDNVVVHYINGQMSLTSSNIETTQTGKFNATMSVGINIAVPVLRTVDENGNALLTQAVRSVLDTYFGQNRTGSILSEGVTYSYGVQYTIAQTGGREQRIGIGDSMTFFVGAEYFFLQDGVNSSSTTLTIDGRKIDYILLGMRRGFDAEPNIPSDSEVAKSVTNGTTFSINFDVPVTLGQEENDFLIDCVMDGELNIWHDVVIERAHHYKNGTVTYKTWSYKMIFGEAASNAQVAYNMSASYTMQEADERVCKAHT